MFAVYLYRKAPVPPGATACCSATMASFTSRAAPRACCCSSPWGWRLAPRPAERAEAKKHRLVKKMNISGKDIGRLLLPLLLLAGSVAAAESGVLAKDCVLHDQPYSDA